MKSVSEILLQARTALRENRGWGCSVGAYLVWMFLEGFGRQISGALPPLAFLVVCYLLFVKTFGQTLLGISVMRGEPRFGHAFAGFGRGWRTLVVHCWIEWRLLGVVLFWLLPLAVLGSWCGSHPDRARQVFSETVRPFAEAHPVATGLLALAVFVAAAAPTLAAWYNYRLAYCVFVDHADGTARAAVDESRRLMAGRRGTMFRLDLWLWTIGLALTLPGLYTFVQGCVDLVPLLPRIRETVMASPGDPMELFAELQKIVSASVVQELASGVLFLFLAGFVKTLWLDPYWSTAVAAFYENVLDLEEARTTPSEVTP